MNIRNYVIAILLLALGVESYLLFKAHSRESLPAGSADVPGSFAPDSRPAGNGHSDEIERLRNRIRELEREAGGAGVPLEPEPASVSAPSLNRMRTVTGLVDRGFISVGLSLLANDGGISEGVIDIFELDGPEVREIEDVVDETLGILTRLTEEHSEVSIDDDGNLVISTQPFIEAGREVYAGITDRLETIVGAERQRALLRLLDDRFERDFDHFGAMQRTFTISLQDERAGRSRLMVENREEYGMGSSSQSRSFTDIDDVRDAYKALANLIPEEFPQGASPE